MVDPMVKLDNGFIRGVVEKHEDGFDYYAFKGIPFAEPPIGKLRFEDPIPKANWEGVLECKDYSEPCLYYNAFTNTSSSNEDCLYLNVFSNSIDEKNVSRAVMIVIHVGVYLWGSGDDDFHGPEYLIRKDVVVVTINHRLGILGFLNLEDEVAPGNQGLKDQLLALQWVQRNIRVFGGDPDNVTLLGVGSGAVCAHYLSLSPLSRGLFHKIIFQEGLLQMVWSFAATPKRNAIKICQLLGRDLLDSREIVQFLKSVDAVKLQEAQKQLVITSNVLPFTPGHDRDSANPVMPIHPDIMAKQGVHYPCIAGITSHGAAGVIIGLTFKEYLEVLDKDIAAMLKYNMEDQLYRYNLTPRELRRLYYGNEAISEDNLINYVNLLNDLLFVDGFYRFLRIQAERSSAATYVYKFNYCPTNSISSIFVKNKPNVAAHFDDLPYIFKMRIFEKLKLNYFEKGTKDYELMNQMTEMWTNFAKYGKPTVGISALIPVEWKPMADTSVIRYLNIDSTFSMESTVNFELKLLKAKN